MKGDTASKDIDISSQLQLDGICSVASSSNSAFGGDTSESPISSRNTEMEVESTFDWRSYINCSDFRAVPVQDFKHAPLSGLWHKIKVGMKVEVENKDIDTGNHESVYWIASVIEIKGYYGLLRYDGAGDDLRKFWIHLCSPEIHRIGWSAKNGKELIPPQSLKFVDLESLHDFVFKNILDKTTFPLNFREKVNKSKLSCFKVGTKWEVVDKKRIRQLKLATIWKVVGQRLYMQYFDSKEDEGFWFHERSRHIHPRGWAKTIGHEIVAPSDYNPREFPPTPSEQKYKGLEVGMIMEAINPLRPCVIGIGTIMQVLERGYVMVKVEGTYMDARKEGNDWYCYHITSPGVFPYGFCEKNGILLIKPNNWNKNNIRTVPEKMFQKLTIIEPKPDRSTNYGYAVGMKVEAADPMEPCNICPATISRIQGPLLKIHFDGWEEEQDQWLDAGSPDIYPVGWCDLVNHKLKVPPPPQIAFQPVPNGAAEGKKRGPGRPRKTTTTVPPVPSQEVNKFAPPKVSLLIAPNASAAVSSSETPLLPGTNGAVEGKKRGPGRPRKRITTVPPVPSQVANKSALPIVSPEPIAPKANAVETAPHRTYIQDVRSSHIPLQLGTNGAVKEKKRGPGRPPKSTTRIPPSSTQVVKKAAIPKVETTEPIPAKASAVGTTSRRCSIQQQAQQLKVEQNIRSTVPEDMDTSLIIASSPESPVLPKMEFDSGTNNTDSESIGLENLTGGTRLGGSAKTESTSRKSSTDTESSSTGVPPKIPILSPDNPDTSCENVDPSIWGPREVVAFLDTNGCADHSDGFLKNKISGSSLMALRKYQIIILTGMKVRPALKILSLIDQLKRSVKSRNALGK